ncbi:MAG: excinuclease ABC subunit UvrA [Bacteroidaceae bacterium]|nr:excinuclease ABC subunit UvrA [Bacteroidaceae bacterium]
MDSIIIKGARVNNLKNINVEIPRNKFVVITGVSGSGKSSLAFDTLYAEGQRRYVESLSTYARQFMGRMGKPECDFIEGIPPAIAIEQKVVSRNPRSTVGTSTEIYDYLRMLFARVGHTFSPISGQEVKKNTQEDVIECMKSYPEGTRFMVLCPLICRNGRTEAEQIAAYDKQGLSLTDTIDGRTCLIISRMTVRDDKANISHLVDSCETAIYEGEGQCILKFLTEGKEILHHFSLAFEADGITFEEPTEHMFSFNSPIGACPTCEGFGKIMGIDESLVIPNQEMSVYDGAVFCWRGEKMSVWKNEFCRIAASHDFPIFEPYYNLTQEQRDFLWHGETDAMGRRLHPDMPCIDAFFDMLRENQYKIQYRVMLSRYRGKEICPTCHGTRLKREANYVKVGGRSITELVEMPISELCDFFQHLQLSDHDTVIAKRLLVEINNRLHFLMDVGLSYLTLNRLSNTLSGGESQRINLATSLGSSLVGSLYILDEPSIGLHSRDTQRLIKVLKELRELGNTVVVVEHDEEIIRAADYIIDIGPDAGRLGGKIVWQGNANDVLSDSPAKSTECSISHTIDFLTHRETIDVPTSRRPWNNYILIRCARENNLKGIDVKIPLNVMTVVTGVSGSGKSTLVRDIFYRAVMRQMDRVCDRPGQFVALEGDVGMIESIEFVDQNPIGTSTRSNPVTYIGAYDEIRKLMASQQLAKQMGYTAQYFSFNTEGGRCEECKGEGTVTVEMQFMNDLVLECESCHGRRFKNDILEVKFYGKDIHDILNLTVNMAVEFFSEHGQKKIVQKLKPLQDVGLGYIKLGQTSSTLSGGESQRVKLAYYLSQEKTKPTMFIFDEPTTGLHFHDIKKLLAAFQSLISRGHSILIIEHNMEIIKSADHIIDLGPEGGAEGGYLVCEGTPKQVAACPESYTGQALRQYIIDNL